MQYLKEFKVAEKSSEKYNTRLLSGSRMKLEDGLEYSIFITVIIDDPIYCEKHSNRFHSRHCLKVSTFLIHHAPGATWPEPTKKTSQRFLVAILLELPVPVVQRADLRC